MGFRLEPERPGDLPSPGAGVDQVAVGGELRRMFDDLVSSPMPKSLLDLCDALDDAFRRGELGSDCGRKRNA